MTLIRYIICISVFIGMWNKYTIILTLMNKTTIQQHKTSFSSDYECWNDLSFQKLIILMAPQLKLSSSCHDYQHSINTTHLGSLAIGLEHMYIPTSTYITTYTCIDQLGQTLKKMAVDKTMHAHPLVLSSIGYNVILTGVLFLLAFHFNHRLANLELQRSNPCQDDQHKQVSVVG